MSCFEVEKISSSAAACANALFRVKIAESLIGIHIQSKILYDNEISNRHKSMKEHIEL